MTHSARRRALLRWMAATGLALPVLIHLPRAAHAARGNGDLESFLAALLRQLFPHDELDGAVYRQAALIVAGAVEADPGFRALVMAGWEDLDAAGDGPWLGREPGAQSTALATSSDTAFFQALRSLGGLVFYSLPAVWALVGYEGPSFAKGGYLGRGFNDIDWLPDDD